MSLRGGVITRRPLCLTDDGKLFFAPCGKDVRVYSAISGEHVGTLFGHTATATAVALDPANSGQVRCRRRPPLAPQQSRARSHCAPPAALHASIDDI